MTRPLTARGVRDFAPEILYKRYYIINVIKNVFYTYGFEPLETPAIEQVSTLLGKYGEEGDKLIFRIIDNGEIASRVTPDMSSKSIVNALSEKALRYDLTIPFARFVAMNRDNLTLPFKRYQIQPVWRGDKPQKGRYREFLQCDADIVGSDSLLQEVEILTIYDKVFTKLGIPKIRILINSRKILSALITLLDKEKEETKILSVLDKIDKIGTEKVLILLKEILSDSEKINKLATFLKISGTNEEQLKALSVFFENSQEGMNGLWDLQFVNDFLKAQSLQNRPEITLSLARGLDYYTGLITEVKTTAVAVGSLGGGGRYDELGQSFGVNGICGVGISFGIDRIYDVMETLQLFPEENREPRIIFLNMGAKEIRYIFPYVQKLRAEGLVCELYPDSYKLDKQFKYAEKKKSKWVAIFGADEMEAGYIQIKNLSTGLQKVCPLRSLTRKLIEGVE